MSSHAKDAAVGPEESHPDSSLGKLAATAIDNMVKESKEDDPTETMMMTPEVSVAREAANAAMPQEERPNGREPLDDDDDALPESQEKGDSTQEGPASASVAVLDQGTAAPAKLATVGKSAPAITTSPSSPRSKVQQVVSLDRAAVDMSDLDEPNESPPLDGRNDQANGGQDADSSDDESSYFAKHLPSPKSSRRYSFSSNASNASAPARTKHHDANRETDASLSFSDESDDAHHSDSGLFPTAAVVRSPVIAHFQPYPHQITRMRSVSSLVSTSSHNSSGTDRSVGDELHNAANEQYPGRRSGVPSGRQSPILGEHPPSRPRMFFSSPSSNLGDPSPPTILPGYSHQAGLPHPQPHLVAQEQWAAWAAGNAAVAQQQQRQQQMHPYGAYGAVDPDIRASLQSSSSAWSNDTLAYSEDGGEISRNPFIGQASNQPRIPQAMAQGRRTLARVEEPLDGDGNAPDDGRSLVQDASKERSAQDVAVANPGVYKEKTFEVYWQRWIMLMYMSVLNLLSDWTCYSVAPIALLTEEAFGSINPEQLVVIFLCANGLSTACEPIILSRLGLRRTVLFGALLLMIGSIVKSGGMPPIIQADLQKGQGEWRVYLGFFLVGLSQPLYQCTPALLSASWFPERERTLATGVALNSNQLGIGFAFIFGTLLVSSSDDIPSYFGLLSLISTITFLGVLIQFDDAPPTPPSDTARVMRGTFESNLPSLRQVFDSFRGGTNSDFKADVKMARSAAAPSAKKPDSKPSKSKPERQTKEQGSSRRSSGGTGTSSRPSSRRTSRSSSKKSQRVSSARGSAKDEAPIGTGTRRSSREGGFHGLAPAPSPAHWGRVSSPQHGSASDWSSFPAPSPMMPEGTGAGADERRLPEGAPPAGQQGVPYMYQHPAPYDAHGRFAQPNMQYIPEMQYPPGSGENQSGHSVAPGVQYGPPDSQPYGYAYQGYPHPQYQQPQHYWDPRFQPISYYQQEESFYEPPVDPQYYSYQHAPLQPYPMKYQTPRNVLPTADSIDEGAEPVLTMTPHHLDINIRDDQILLSTRACLARPGFIHALVAFTVSGIVINTLSTYMDYLVRLNGAGREYTGIVGGSFQFAIMISSLIIGQVTDRTRAYYSVTVGMLVLGAFGLAECGVDLDENRGTDLRFALVIVAILVGPLQPVSTEMGVDVVYPLSENTVLVIQQLFSNLLSALFIPCFKAMKDIGREAGDEEERPEYTFSFYLMIVLHAAATVFFATFNGRYLRLEHEVKKKAKEAQRRAEATGAAFHPVHGDHGDARYPGFDGRQYWNEQQPFGFDDRQYQSEQQPLGADNRPYRNEQQPSGADDRQYKNEQQQSGADDRPYRNEQQSGADDRPYRNEQQPLLHPIV